MRINYSGPREIGEYISARNPKWVLTDREE